MATEIKQEPVEDTDLETRCTKLGLYCHYQRYFYIYYWQCHIFSRSLTIRTLDVSYLSRFVTNSGQFV